MKDNKKLELIHHRIIEQVSENMKFYGYARTIGRVLAIIHYEGKPMNLDELSEKTGMSKTRMSQVLREMHELHIAEKVFVKGSRKDTYIVEEDYYQTFLTLVTQNWRNLVKRNIRVEERLLRDLEEILQDEQASEKVKEEAKAYYEDSLDSLDYFDWISRLADFFESKEIFNYVPIKKKEERNDLNE